MNNDVIRDISAFDSHPSNMAKYINDIIKVIEDIRAEGYEMYSVVMERKSECQQEAAKFNARIQEVKRYTPNDSDSQLDELNKRIKHCEDNYSCLEKSQRQLDNIAQQCVQMRRTVELLNENVQKTNGAFIDTMKYYNEAK